MNSDPGDTVTITLKKDELRLLTELTYLAQWVVCAGDFPDREFRDRVEALEQTIYRQSLDLGNADLVYHDEGHDCVYPTASLEESTAWEAIRFFENEAFWEELVSRLAGLYAAQDHSEQHLESLSNEDRFVLLCSYEDRIRKILAKDGLHSVVLVPDDL